MKPCAICQVYGYTNGSYGPLGVSMTLLSGAKPTHALELEVHSTKAQRGVHIPVVQHLSPLPVLKTFREAMTIFMEAC